MPSVVLRAIAAGYAALDLIGGNHAWRVHSIFRRACNLQAPSGRILSLVTADVPPSPINVVTDLAQEIGWLGLGLTPGIPLKFDGARVLTDDGSLRIALSRAATFVPMIHGPVGIRPDRVPAMLALAAHYGMERGPKAGFQALLPHAERLFPPNGTPPLFDDDFCRLGYEHTAALVNAVRASDGPRLRESVRGLLGLGPGLTPSGDDALAGLMVAAALTAKALACPARIFGKIGEIVVQETSGATTDLSGEFLRYAAQGEGNAVNEEVIGSILQGREESIVFAVAKLMGFGASSGVDQLWGILVGVRLGLLPPDPTQPPSLSLIGEGG